MQKRLNLLLVTNLYPTPVESTRGIFVYQLVKRLRVHCDITVVCPLPWFPAVPLPATPARWRSLSRVPQEYSIDGAKVYSPKYPMIPRISENFHAILMSITLYPLIKKLHAQRHFDVMNAQWLYPDGVAAARISQRLGIPLVLSALGSDVNVFIAEEPKWKQIVWSLKRAAAITTVSQAFKDRLVGESVPQAKITVIPNGADCALFKLRSKVKCRTTLRLDPQRKAIIFVGRLVEIKGVDYLIDAAEKLSRRHQDFIVYLLGDGHLRDAYERDIRARGLAEKVKCMGGRSHSEIPVWMGAADVFCLPSLQEGCPNVVLEALFSGRPVVASRAGGVPEMVNTRNGVLVEPGDAAGLCDGLDRALAKLWDAQAIRDSVSHFTWETAAEDYHRVFVSAHKSKAG